MSKLQTQTQAWVALQAKVFDQTRRNSKVIRNIASIPYKLKRGQKQEEEKESKKDAKPKAISTSLQILQEDLAQVEENEKRELEIEEEMRRSARKGDTSPDSSQKKRRSRKSKAGKLTDAGSRLHSPEPDMSPKKMPMLLSPVSNNKNSLFPNISNRNQSARDASRLFSPMNQTGFKSARRPFIMGNGSMASTSF